MGWREDFGIEDDSDIVKAAKDDIENGLNQQMVEVRDYWRSISPEETGDYKDQFVFGKFELDDGTPGRRVANMSRHAHLVEYGAEDQEPHSPRAKTANHFGNEGRYLAGGSGPAPEASL